MKKNSLQLKPLSAIVLMLCSNGLYAQESDIAVLSEITAHQDYLAVTASDTQLNTKDLEKANVQNWSDIAKRLDAGINFNTQNNSINMRGLDAQRVQVTEDGIPLPWLNDGARGVMGGVSGINFNAISSVDIHKGTGGNGTNALAGAVELYSLRPSDVLDVARNIGLLSKVGYSGYDNSWSADAALAFRLGDKTRALIQYGYKAGNEVKNLGSVGGYGVNRTKANPADYDMNQFGIRLEHDLNSNHRIGFGASSYRQERTIDERHLQGGILNARTQQLVETYPIGQYEGSEDIKRDRAWLEYDYKAPTEFSGLDQVSGVAYWQKSELINGIDAWRNNNRIVRPGGMSFNAYPFGDYSRTNSVKEQSYGFNLKASGTFGDASFSSRWMAGLTWDIGQFKQYSAGVDNCGAAQAELNTILSQVPPALRGRLAGTISQYFLMGCSFLHTNQADVPKVKTQDLGLYLQNTFAWNSNQFEVTPGLRFDYYQRRPSASANFAESASGVLGGELANRSGSRFSPSIDFRFQASDSLSLYARYTEGFRAPNAQELYMKYGSEANYLRKGNANLRPETSRGYELGAMYNSDTLNASLVFFDQYYKNFIESGYAVEANSPYAALQAQGLYPQGVFETRNITRARIYGIEAAAKWDFQPDWYVRSSLAWSVGRDKTNDTYLNSVAPLKAIVGIGYDNGSFGVDATLTMAAKRNKVRSDVADFKAPGYGVVDLSAYWEPESLKGLRLQAGLMNVFNKKYWNALNVPTAGTGRNERGIDYYTERGRYATVSVSYRY